MIIRVIALDLFANICQNVIMKRSLIYTFLAYVASSASAQSSSTVVHDEVYKGSIETEYQTLLGLQIDEKGKMTFFDQQQDRESKVLAFAMLALQTQVQIKPFIAQGEIADIVPDSKDETKSNTSFHQPQLQLQPGVESLIEEKRHHNDGHENQSDQPSAQSPKDEVKHDGAISDLVSLENYNVRYNDGRISTESSEFSLGKTMPALLTPHRIGQQAQVSPLGSSASPKKVSPKAKHVVQTITQLDKQTFDETALIAHPFLSVFNYLHAKISDNPTETVSKMSAEDCATAYDALVQALNSHDLAKASDEDKVYYSWAQVCLAVLVQHLTQHAPISKKAEILPVLKQHMKDNAYVRYVFINIAMALLDIAKLDCLKNASIAQLAALDFAQPATISAAKDILAKVVVQGANVNPEAKILLDMIDLVEAMKASGVPTKGEKLQALVNAIVAKTTVTDESIAALRKSLVNKKIEDIELSKAYATVMLRFQEHALSSISPTSIASSKSTPAAVWQ